ncbi:hypothetical protein CB1_000896004 [Camelus ferus]|nr:hypothetical protein CB1_000896004 [Camelus ferus]
MLVWTPAEQLRQKLSVPCVGRGGCLDACAATAHPARRLGVVTLRKSMTKALAGKASVLPPEESPSPGKEGLLQGVRLGPISSAVLTRGAVDLLPQPEAPHLHWGRGRGESSTEHPVESWWALVSCDVSLHVGGTCSSSPHSLSSPVLEVSLHFSRKVQGMLTDTCPYRPNIYLACLGFPSQQDSGITSRPTFTPTHSHTARPTCCSTQQQVISAR